MTGAHVTSMHYTLHADGVTVDTVTFVAAGDLTLGVPQEHGFVGFTVGGTPGPIVDCGIGTYDGSTATTFVCDVTGLAPIRRHHPGDRHRRLQLTTGRISQ